MKTIILPGYSLSNRDWAVVLAKKIKVGHKILVHHWRHWEKGGGLSLKYESEKIFQEVGDDRINIIAKSVGASVTAYILPKLRTQVNKIILCGIPFVGSPEREKKFNEAFADFPAERVLCFQNEKDPWGKYELVKKFVSSISPKIKVISNPSSDHNYPYPEAFEDFLRDS